MKSEDLNNLVEVPERERAAFDSMIASYREATIRSSRHIVEEIFKSSPSFSNRIKNKEASRTIFDLREAAWQEFLKDEVHFNATLMKDLHTTVDTPGEILDLLIHKEVLSMRGSELEAAIRKICGEYAGRVFPYIYRLSLSNTQSRRSRAGTTFEAIIYKIYEILDYTFDSQSKVGRKIFDELGLGKKVDSIIPGVDAFAKRRNKTIIGTMKTSLRERWQEVAEEIERTNIPEIHLLTSDEDITESKAKEMSNHNIVVVAYSWVSDSKQLLSMKNIVSFEEYLYEEIPKYLNYWKS